MKAQINVNDVRVVKGEIDVNTQAYECQSIEDQRIFYVLPFHYLTGNIQLPRKTKA